MPHDGQVKWLGFFPSTQSIFAHLPHNIEVLTGSSRVVSILNIARPASGMNEALGIQDSCANSVFPSSLSIERPRIRRIIPPMDNGADIDMASMELS